MGKKKKVQEKLRTYYRGPVVKPTKVASDEEMDVILRAFGDCIPLRSDFTFYTIWDDVRINLRILVGLKASLRHLKRGETKAVIYDDTAGRHLAKYLNHFASKQNVPIIEAKRLIDHCKRFKLDTMMIVSFVQSETNENKGIYKTGDPRPKIIDKTMSSKAFDDLCSLLQKCVNKTPESRPNIVYKPPLTEKVPSKGTSQAKKRERRKKKLASKTKRTTEAHAP